MDWWQWLTAASAATMAFIYLSKTVWAAMVKAVDSHRTWQVNEVIAKHFRPNGGSSLPEVMNRVDGRLDEVEQRLDRGDARFDTIDAKLEKIDMYLVCHRADCGLHPIDDFGGANF